VTSYEGLNLPQLLDLMHGLELPEAPGGLPQGPGWWLLAGWLVAVACIGLFARIRARQRDHYRRDALEALSRIDVSSPDAGAEIGAVLKRTALAAYPRERVASLTGRAWAEFLKETGADAEVAASAEALARAAYAPTGDAAPLVLAAERWVLRHRA
jgi:hypothetical protein